MPLADKQHLLGACIDRIEPMTPDQQKHLGWQYGGVIIRLSNGFSITCATDDEFSHAGHFMGLTRGGVVFPFYDPEEE